MIESLVERIAKRLNTEVSVTCRCASQPDGRVWHASISKDGAQYSYHFGHGDTPEEAILNALVDNIQSIRSELKKLQPKPAAPTKDATPTNGELVAACHDAGHSQERTRPPLLQHTESWTARRTSNPKTSPFWALKNMLTTGLQITTILPAIGTKVVESALGLFLARCNSTERVDEFVLPLRGASTSRA